MPWAPVPDPTRLLYPAARPSRAAAGADVFTEAPENPLSLTFTVQGNWPTPPQLPPPTPNEVPVPVVPVPFPPVAVPVPPDPAAEVREEMPVDGATTAGLVSRVPVPES